MARPTKQGIDYFPLDVDFDLDDKFQLVMAKHGAIGGWVVTVVLCKIYSEGYFYYWNEREQLLISRRVNVDINSVIDVINSAIHFGIFDQDKYETYKILTSNGIQKRYIEAVKKRKEVTIIKEYLINEGINSVNSNIKLINSVINPQSKVKYSKVNNNKVNKTKEEIAVSKTETASPKTVVSESHTKAIEMFCDYYQNKTGIKYSFTGKDAKQIQSLLTRIAKLITIELNKENLLKSFDYFLKNLNDNWVIENLSISVINSKFNEILNKIKNHDKFRENSNKRGFVNDTDKWESILEYARTGAGSESAGAVFSSQERENTEGNILALDRQVF